MTLPGDESVYSLSSKDEWFHYNEGEGGKKELGQLVVINSSEGEELWRAP